MRAPSASHLKRAHPVFDGLQSDAHAYFVHSYHFIADDARDVLADVDYGEIRLYPGNYDQYMEAALLARSQLLADNEKKQAQLDDLKNQQATDKATIEEQSAIIRQLQADLAAARRQE